MQDRNCVMQALTRISLTLALALSVALASIGHAQARHQAQGAATMVICTGYGLVKITLNADGEPVELTLPCPDCILTQMALLADPSPDLFPALLPKRLILTQSEPMRHRGDAGFWPQSRAPPFSG
ncbi:MAG: hypothetical protein JJU24_00345 [Natronohydrobacter sp.]|nr:hypothetical protein [Natronohydrobacter sp.]